MSEMTQPLDSHSQPAPKFVDVPPTSEPEAKPNNVTPQLVLAAFLIGSICFVFCFVIATLVSPQGASLFKAVAPNGSKWPASLFVDVPPAPVLSVLLCFGINWIAWIPASIIQTERFYDLVGSLTFLSTVGAAFGVAGHYGMPMTPWRVLPALLVGIWTLRLGIFLFHRVMTSDRGDRRFDELKINPARFFIPWTLQAVWVFLTSIAMVVQVTSPQAPSHLITSGQAGSAAASSASNNNDLLGFFDFTTILGLVVWFGGFILEVTADRQKSVWAQNPANKGRYIRVGVWDWCRHPNYFGEMTLWWGMYILGFRSYVDAQWICVLSPLLTMTLLLFVSGLPQLEKMSDDRWGKEPEYQQYKQEVHVIIPFASACACCRSTRPLSSEAPASR